MKAFFAITSALLALWLFTSSSAMQVATPTTEPHAPPTRDEMVAQAQTNASTDLEKRVLEDGVVTPEEYQEAVDAYLVCMADSGYNVTVTESPYLPGTYDYQIEFPDQGDVPDMVSQDPSNGTPQAATPAMPVVIDDADFEAFVDVDEKCSTGTTMYIEAIYTSDVSNPNDQDRIVLTLDCLETTGVLPVGDMTAEELEAHLTSDEVLPRELHTEQGTSCLVNPAQNGIDGDPVLPSNSEATPSS